MTVALLGTAGAFGFYVVNNNSDKQADQNPVASQQEECKKTAEVTTTTPKSNLTVKEWGIKLFVCDEFSQLAYKFVETGGLAFYGTFNAENVTIGEDTTLIIPNDSPLTFDCVQQLRAAGKRRHDKSGRLCLFSGITYCADCGSRMYFSSGACIKPEQDYFVCSGFRTKKRVFDSSHYIRRVVLESLILE
ncbi:MAG: zinc ribbon domain-containing protein [Oscillospiraceae bacterium]|nr:zinc ribbon domain-containing protein [Oscillospiraceae bacterium]